MAEIVIEIEKDGTTHIEGHEIQGADCKALTEDLENRLGDVTNVTLKPEYHQPRKVTLKVGL